MNLSDFPVPSPNNKFGMHLRPDKCQDMSGRNFDWHYQQLYELTKWGCQWVNIITSPGGGGPYQGARPGCSELTFDIANELEFGFCLRIFGAATPPYWYGDVQANLRQLVKIAKRPFYVKPCNEIDIEWETDAGRRMNLADAKSACRGVAEFISRCWDEFGGMVIPGFLNVGYGGTGWNFFEIMNGEGSFYGDQLDRCWVPVHPYNGPTDIWWPWCETLLKPILLTREEYDARGRWAWQLDNIGARQTFEYVNAARQRMHDERMHLWDEVDLEKAYARGYFTHKWALNQLDRAGHPNTPVGFPEMGTEVGSMIPGIECVGPAKHMALNLEQIADMQKNPRILFGCFWFNDAYGAVKENWRTQGWKSPHWDKKTHENMPPDWEKEIVVPGELPIVSYLREHPVTISAPPIVNKLGPHFQRSDAAWLGLAAKCRIAKTMDLSADWCRALKTAVGANALVIGRAYIEEQDRVYTDPQAVIDDLLLLYANAAPYLDAVEFVNELVNNSTTPAQLAAFDAAQVAFAQQVWARWPGMKVVLFSLPTGNWGEAGEPNLASCPLSMALPVEKVFIGDHGYGWPEFSTSAEWYVLRYRKLLAAWPEHCFVINELGVTHAIVAGQPDVGWRTQPGGDARETYIKGLQWVNVELCKDPQVVGATVYLVGQSYNWETFESGAELDTAIAASLGVPPGEEPPVTPTEPPVVVPPGQGPYPFTEPTLWKLPDWDPAQLVKAMPAAGEVYWHVTAAVPGLDNMANTLWFNVEGIHPDGTLPDGARVMMHNADGSTVALPVKAPPDLIDCPMFKHDIRSWWIEDNLGRKSDKVDNIRGDIENLPPGVNAFHIPRIFSVGLRTAPGTVPPVDPPPVVTPPTGTTSKTIDVVGQLTIITKDGAVVDYIAHLQPK